MKLVRSLAGQAATYGLSSVLGRVLNYLLVPLYTAVFLPGTYGIVTELYAYMAFLNVVFVYGMETAFFRFSTKSEDKKNVYSNIQSAILVTTFFLGIFLLAYSGKLSQVLAYPDRANLIRWCVFILAIDALVAIPFAQLRLEGKAIQFAVFRLANIVLNISFNLFFLLYLPWSLSHPEAILSFEFLQIFYNPSFDVEYVFISNLLANAAYLLWLFRRLINIQLVLDFGVLKPILKYALPLLILGLAGVTNEMLSRALLKYLLPVGFYSHLTNLEALGIFGACYKLSVFMTLAVQAFRYAFEPFFFNQAKDEHSPVLFAKVMSAFVLFASSGWLIISMVLPELAPIFLRQEAYLEGLQIVPLLLGGGLFLGIYYNLSLWYKLTDKTWYGAVISMAGAFVTLILNIILIPKMGYMGSAWATLVTYLSMTLISFFWGRRHYLVPYRLLPICFYLIAAGGTIYLFQEMESILFRYLTGFAGLLILMLITLIFERKYLLSSSKN